MDIELLEAYDDEADQGYYEDESVSTEELQKIVEQTGKISGGMPFERLPGQVAAPMDNGVPAPRTDDLPGQLGKDVFGN